MRLCGFDFVYLPKVIEHYNSVSRETLYQMVSLLYPHIDDSRLTAMPHWLDTMSTARFCEELFASKLRIKAISGVAPSLLVRMGHSAVSGKTYANYLLLELGDDVRNTVRFVSDILRPIVIRCVWPMPVVSAILLSSRVSANSFSTSTCCAAVSGVPSS